MLYDRSTVPPLGAYPATQCPVRVRFEFDPPPGETTTPPSASDQQRIDAGRAFEADVFDQLVALHGAVQMAGPDSRVGATMEALASGQAIVCQPVLPHDLVGRRSGKPDLLIRAGDGYLPVDLKHHSMVEGAPGQVASFSTLDEPWPSSRQNQPDTRLKRDRALTDGRQLAHYWRMLEQHGLTPTAQEPLGAILGSDGLIWWIPLGEAVWNYATLTRLRPDQKVFSLLEIYDHEFDFRLDVAAHTLLARTDPTLGPKVEPIKVGECDTCPWWQGHCAGWLEENDHVSLLPGQNWLPFVAHRARNVTTRRDVAALDPVTATWVDAVRTIKPAQRDQAVLDDDAQPIGELKNKKLLEVVRTLIDDDTMAVGDFHAGLDQATLAYQGVSLNASLRDLIDDARAVTSGAPWLRRGASPEPPAEHVVEVDIDMENGPDGSAYLWGLWITEPGVDPRYEAIDHYGELDDEAHRDLTGRLAARIGELRSAAVAHGGTLALYHWSAAEFRPIAALARAGVIDEDRLGELGLVLAGQSVRGPEWIDLETVWRRNVITGRGSSVKTVIKLIGHEEHYAVDLPGGNESFVHYERALTDVAGGVDPAASEGVRWLRTYNEGDVKATWQIRRWLREHMPSLPRIEDWSTAAARR